jgi:hypothetical protein
MGANVFSRLPTQRDVARIFSQVKGSPLDSVRRRQKLRNSLTRKRSLVQIQYGPRFFVFVFDEKRQSLVTWRRGRHPRSAYFMSRRTLQTELLLSPNGPGWYYACRLPAVPDGMALSLAERAGNVATAPVR